MALLASITRLGLGGPGTQYPGFAAAAATAVITGSVSVDSPTEAEIVAGGETIIITLTNDTWVASGGTFNGQRQAIIDGLDSAQSETAGWNAEVRDKEEVGAVVRTSNTVVTITLTAAGAYSVVDNETITVTVPADAMTTTSSELIATPTFDVTAEAAVGGSFFPQFARGVRLKRRNTFKEFTEKLEVAFDRAVEGELPEPEVEAEEPAKVSRPQRRRIQQAVHAEIADSGLLIGEVRAIERELNRLVDRRLAQRRVDSRLESQQRLEQQRLAIKMEDEAILTVLMLVDSD